MSLLQTINLITVSRLIDWPAIPLARGPALVFTLAVVAGPLVVNSYLLLRGRSERILRRAELYDHLSMGWGAALTVAYGVGSFVLLCWSFGVSLPF